MIRPGALVANRQHIAALGRRFPHLTRTGMTLRWMAWAAYGWPFAALGWSILAFTCLLIPALALAGVLPWRLMWQAFSGWFETLWSLGDVSPAAAMVWVVGTIFLLGYLSQRKEAEWVRKWAFTGWGKAAVIAGLFTFAGATIGSWPMTLLLALVPVLWFADAKLGQLSEEVDGRRLFAEFRRELPVQWAILAGKSPKVQSFDTALESTVGDAASNRPLLEAPAMWLFPRQVSPYVFEVPAWRTPGRGLKELQDVVDELAAQYPSVADWENSIEMLWPERDGSNFASWAWMRIHFKNREQRRNPFGGGAPVPTGGRFGFVRRLFTAPSSSPDGWPETEAPTGVMGAGRRRTA